MSRIFYLRGRKVMLDKDLALLYEVKTIVLRQQVKRNSERFPEDFMFQMSKKEAENMVSQNVIPSMSYFGGSLPYVFTEQGVSMLSSVLRSKRAIQVNLQIMRTFVKLREMLSSNKDLQEKIERMERKYDQQFQVVFEAIKHILLPPETSKPIGFLRKDRGKQKQ
ncbi:ORF6N domain-containing protein [Thermoproteota archaeon]